MHRARMISISTPLQAAWELVTRQGWGVVPLAPDGRDEPGYLVHLISQIGTVLPQDAAGTQVWDVRYAPDQAVPGVARSLTLDEFPFHTDGAYEDPSPRYIALYVVREDRLGGGQSQLKCLREILGVLRPETRSLLATVPFRFHAPVEFRREADYRDLPIIFNDVLVRYRREIIDDSVCTPQQRQALDELDHAVAAAAPSRLDLNRGELLLVDNARMLHARTKVLDPQRHLYRLRFADLEAARVMG